MAAIAKRRKLIAIILAFAGLFLCLTIIQNENLRLTIHRQTRQLFQGQQKEGKCGISWRHAKINVTFYEIQRHRTVTREIGGGGVRQLKSVTPIFERPSIRLDPDKFLLPIVTNGPNNQITGLREATYVGIMLNRTIVLPKFYKHHSDASHNLTSYNLPSIYLGHRLEIDDFCTYVSCITMDQFQQACGGQVDAVVHLVRYNRRDIIGWEKYTGMSLKRIRPTNSEEPEIELIPTTPLRKGQKARKFRSDEINSLFDSSARCVIYPRPLFNLQGYTSNQEKRLKTPPLVEKVEDIPKFPPTRLFRTIVKHTQSPKYIKQIAQEFVNVTTGRQPFLAVHWRYNLGDYMRRCGSLDKPGTNKMRIEICMKAMSIKPKDIARSIENRINFLRNESRRYNIQNIYIASPPSERNVVAAVADILFYKHGWITRSSLDLEEYLKFRFQSCETQQKHFFDIVSTAEMEICSLSLAFLGSIRSSWTGNVRLVRGVSEFDHVLPQYDGDIFMTSLKTRKRRGVSGP